MATKTRTSTAVKVVIGVIVATAVIALGYATTTTVKPNLAFSVAPAISTTAPKVLTFTYMNNGSVGINWQSGQHPYLIEWLTANGTITGTTCSGTVTGTWTMSTGTASKFSSATDTQCGTWFSTVPSGATSLAVILDPSGVVGETSEVDNIGSVTLPLPNLAFSVTPTVSNTNGRILKFTMTNKGSAAIDWQSGQYPYMLEWFNAAGAIIGSQCKGTVTGLWTMSVGTSFAFSSATDTQCGTWLNGKPVDAAHLGVFLDPGGVVTETSDDDNFQSLKLLPDLYISVAPTATAITGGISLKFTWANYGFAAINWLASQPEYMFQWLGSDGSVKGTSCYGIVTTNWTMGITGVQYSSATDAQCGKWFATRPSGATILSVILDPNGVVPEMSEVNNIATVNLP